MFHRDYLMRQIEQLTAALGSILLHRQHRQMEEAQRLLHEAARHLLGLNLKHLRALSVPDMIALLTVQSELDRGKAVVVMELLREQGDLDLDAGETEQAYRGYLQSLELGLHAAAIDREADPVWRSEVRQRLNHTLERLRSFFIPLPLKSALFAFYEAGGEYDKAENVLFHWLEDEASGEADRTARGAAARGADSTNSAFQAGKLFYERLLRMDAQLLEAGGLSREEAEEGQRLVEAWAKRYRNAVY